MTGDNGFIVLHRKMMNWEWYRDVNTRSLFIHLLLMANHKEQKWHGQTIQRGQLITGRKALAEQTGLSEQQIRTCLTRLKSTSEITINPTNKYTLVTLTNYSLYQDKPKNQPANQPATQPSINQQSTTNNNVNKGNKREEGANAPPTKISQDWNPCQRNTEWMDDAGLSEAEKRKVTKEFRDFWFFSGTKKKNWNLAFRKNPKVAGAVNRAAAKQPEQQPWENAL